MKILNIALAVILASIIALLLFERQRAKDKAVTKAIEALEQEMMDQAVRDKRFIQQAWDEGFIASKKWHDEVVKSFAGTKGRLDPYYLSSEASRRFWAGTNSNPYWKK